MAEININFSTKYAPTLQRFLDSNADVRLAMGPVGSGKSSVCCIEIPRRAVETPPGVDKVRRSRWVVIRNCYDSRTEILTEHRGWVKFPYLDPKERVAALHGDRVVWETPTYHYAAPYRGEMVGLRSQNMDLLVTPEHHLWCSPRQTRKKVWGEFRHYRADELEGSGELYRMRATAEFPGDSTPTEKDLAFYEFLGFWFAEGYAGVYPRADCEGQNFRLVVTQNLDPYVDDLLSRCGFQYRAVHKKGSKSCANYNISTKSEATKDLVRELAKYGKARTKWLPRYIIEASKPLAEAFLRGYHRGDGGGGVKNPSKPEAYHSASKELLDGVHEMLVRQGRSAVLTHRPTSGKNGMWELTALCEKRSSPVILKEHWRREDYDGMVYCVEVSTHVVLVRRNGKAVWCGQTYRELQDTTINTFKEWVPSALGRWHEADKSFHMRFGDVDAEVLFRALDRPDDIGKLLSLEITGAYINELKEVPKAVFDMIQTRIGRFPARKNLPPNVEAWSGLWADTNPPDTDHWIYKLFEEERPPSFEIFKQPGGRDDSAENLPYLKTGYYDRMIAGKSKDWIRVYVDGQYGFVQDGKPIYPEFQDQIHVVPDIQLIPGAVIYVGNDYGLTPAATFAQRDPADGQWQVLSEFVSERLGAVGFASEQARILKTLYRGHKIIGWGDPAGDQSSQVDERTPFEVVNAAGVPVDPAPTNDFTLRREAVAGLLTRLTMLGRPALVIHPSCRYLRKGMNGGYAYRRLQVAGDERYEDKPNKNIYSHVSESLQYIMVGEGEDRRALNAGEQRRVEVKTRVKRSVNLPRSARR